MDNVFKLGLTDGGHQAFAATQFFRQYRKIHQKSIFQWELKMIDPRTISDKIAKELRRRGFMLYEDIESEIFRLFENATVFDEDWSALESVKEKIADNLETIIGELEK